MFLYKLINLLLNPLLIASLITSPKISEKNILFFMKLSTPDAIRNDKFYPLLARSDYKKITLVSALYFHIGYYFLMLVKL